MKKILVLVADSSDVAANQWVESMQSELGNDVERVALDQPDLDYRSLVCRVFAADSVWTIQPPNP